MKMPAMRLLAPSLCTLFTLCLCVQEASAQVDSIYEYGVASATRGSLEGISKDGVAVKVGGNTKNIPSSKIRKINFSGDPAGLTRARDLYADGQYENALKELEEVDKGKDYREVINVDLAFYTFASNANLALAGRQSRETVAGQGIKLVTANPDSFHFYAMARLLGDLALSIKNYDAANKYYGALRNAAAIETKMLGEYLVAVVTMEKGDNDAAIAMLDKVAAVKVQSTEGLRLKNLAKAASAVAMSRSGKGAEGLKLASELIGELNQTDIEMSAKVYNAQGASYEANDDLEGAILAYLHTHLMYSGQTDAHIVALKRLVELWPKVGHPERAAAARQELQQRYPGAAS